MKESIWSHVVNGGKMGAGAHAEDCVVLARKLGYTMFVWIDSLYRVPNDPQARWDSEPLHIKIGELK